MRKKTILIVEDSIDQIQRYKQLVEDQFIVRLATTIEEAEVALNRSAVDILLTDIHLTNSREQNTFEGFEVIELAKKNHPETLILAMSADPHLETYNRAFELGARYFLKKPIVNTAEISIAIDSAQQDRSFERFSRSMRKQDIPKALRDQCEDGLVLSSEVRNAAKGVARIKDIPVVIHGETGTGKEEVAKLIHKRRLELEGPIPFVAVNCASLKDTTALSLLFGHKKGAFTGASETTIGHVGEADGGILFLDEIHRLDEECQARLLRVLNDGTYQRFGDTKELSSNFQVIVASSKDLDTLVEEGSFLMDLRSRITGIDIELKPLRERLDDLDLLVPLYFAKSNKDISADELEKLVSRCKDFYWQGNIRQLFNVLKSLQTACLMNDTPILASSLPTFKTMYDPNIENQVLKPVDEYSHLIRPLLEDSDYKESLYAYEKEFIKGLMSRHRKVSDAVLASNISRGNLDTKIKKYNLQ